MFRINQLKIIYILAIIFLCRCQTDTPVPRVKTNFIVDINTNRLIMVGGYEYFTGGIQGFIVYHVDMNTFVAYDRACAFDWESNGYVIVDPQNTFQLLCEQCGSTYNILNGYPQGANCKATQPLRSYNVRIESDDKIRVYD
ncbi:MAG: hypothetical protein LBR36_05595 [Bacteroidales bacterium]|jgi:nitrite reductase/ring-hydroxylating ferredoxin subunit|nr:hypothetical protein [Bacteroidales bacterium]